MLNYVVYEYNRGERQAPQTVFRTGDKSLALGYAKDVAAHDGYTCVVKSVCGNFSKTFRKE